MKERAVIQHLEEDRAVLLVGQNERKLNARRDELPAGIKEGQWLQVEVGHGRLLSAALAEDETGKAS